MFLAYDIRIVSIINWTSYTWTFTCWVFSRIICINNFPSAAVFIQLLMSSLRFILFACYSINCIVLLWTPVRFIHISVILQKKKHLIALKMCFPCSIPLWIFSHACFSYHFIEVLLSPCDQSSVLKFHIYSMNIIILISTSGMCTKH